MIKSCVWREWFVIVCSFLEKCVLFHMRIATPLMLKLYPDPVRVVSVGVPMETVAHETPWAVEHSVELCGGT